VESAVRVCEFFSATGIEAGPASPIAFVQILSLRTGPEQGH
jgi:hypothetical protein